MAPSTATTTQLNGHYANQYPNHSNKSPSIHLPQNKSYTRYAPNFIIALSTLYLLAFIVHYLLKKCRKYRDKKQQREKQQLKQAWKKTMAKFDILQSKNDSNTLLYPDSAYNKQQSYNSSASSFTLNNQSSPSSPMAVAAIHIDVEIVHKKHQPPSPSSSLSSFATATTTAGTCIKVDPDCHAVALENDDYAHGRPSRHIFARNRLTNYWRITNNKRLALLWQWSVAMGYCEYNHAKDLDDMVLQLQTGKEDKHDASPVGIGLVDE